MDGWIAGQEPTIELDEMNSCEPDVAVLRVPEPVRPLIAGDLPLMVEVADASLRQDRGERKDRAAVHGIPHYWVVNLKDRQVECWSEPADRTYRQETVIPFGRPVPVPGTDQTITLS